MIITDEIKIKTTNKNITHYNNLNYNVKSGDIINIKPIHLPEQSKTKIKVKCDICGKVKDITYVSYTRNIKKYNYYGCSSKCSKQKTIDTSLEKYGVEHYNKTDEFKDKCKIISLEKYGVEHYTQSNLVKDKIKQTSLKKYGEDSYMKTNNFKLKSKKSMIEKYNVVYPLQSDDIKEKWIKTNLKIYGTEYVLQNDKIKNKIKTSKLKNHNDDKYNNRLKFKNTCLNKFGFDNPMKNDIIKQKLVNIIYEKYGVKHHMHIDEIFNKVLKSGLKINKYKDTELYYQGTYEKDFLDNYYDIINIKRGKSIKYIFNDIAHIYYPDFYISDLNLIIEIKSSRWYNMHKERNISKKEYCIKNGFNFLFIIDKNYNVFDNLIKYKLYSQEDVCYQYKIKMDNKQEIFEKLKISDFEIKYIDKSDIIMCKKIVKFIEKYEWLGKMPNRPTHRFVALYKGEIASVIIMSTPNSFSKVLGNDTKNIEKLISRGASAYWTPKNIGSFLVMWSIRWMVNNTQFRLFSAYSDTEAKELGTIYQACNFIYLGQNYGSDYVYFNLDNYKLGWTSGRNYRKLSFYKKICKSNNIEWQDNWNKKYTLLWDNMPIKIKILLLSESKKTLNYSIKRKSSKKHKYIYILGKNKKETKILKNKFELLNPKLINLPYPKNR